MKICALSSELSPFAKTGGLGDAVSGLSRFLHSRDVDLRLFTPFYASSDLQGEPVTPVDFLQDLSIEIGGLRIGYSIDTARLPGSDLPVYLVRCPSLYRRAGIYDDRGDEHLRFAMLSRVAIEACQRMGFDPDLFHLHDWHTALLPLYLRTHYSWDRMFARTRTLLTIHNLAYQGVFPASALGDLGLGSAASLMHQEQLSGGRFSFLTTGILYADQLSTVSPTYAREIQTPEFGYGLDRMLRARADRLAGITNGADYSEWDPRIDTMIAHRYSIDDLSGKERNKRALLESLGLPYEERIPVLGVVSRLTAQKGFDLLFGPLPELLERRNVRLVVLGTGEARFEDFFHYLQRRFPQRAVFYRGFSNRLAHQIQAGSDLFLMPSRFEPCGLSQLYSLRYGTAPVVRRTGGLADTVDLFDSATGRGTGFVFDSYDAEAVRWALGYALDSYDDPAVWKRLVVNAMAQNFSWELQGERYLELYRTVVERG